MVPAGDNKITSPVDAVAELGRLKDALRHMTKDDIYAFCITEPDGSIIECMGETRFCNERDVLMFMTMLRMLANHGT